MARNSPVWEVRARGFDFEAHMARSLGIHPAVATVLRGRGIETVEAAREFLNPSLDHLHDPFELPDMSAAVERIVQAIRDSQTVMIHGDYDVDGITATALLVRFLSKLGVDIQYFIPNRFTDRYGLSIDAVRKAAEGGAALVIAVDCGVTGFEPIAEARRLGLDVIVIDHHEPAETLPDANAIVDPKRADSKYPERELVSAGLCFKTASAVCERLDLPQDSLRRAFLDLVALGTIADVAPLVGENRALTHHGLKLLPQTRKVGLKALLQLCGLDGTVGSSDVGFRIAPRMNAVGRMGDATDALELLLTDDDQEALRIALQLENANRERQREQESTYLDALRLIDDEVDLDTDRVLVLASPDWHIGVVGIVASKILEKHGRPAIMLVTEGEEARGSARSIEGFDINRALEACSDKLIRHGGHALAAGVTLRTGNLDEFRARLNDLAAESISPAEIEPRILIDGELVLDEVDEELLESLAMLEPFGRGNPNPMFITRGVEIISARAVGRDDQHLKLFVSQGDRPVDCIGFNIGHTTKWLNRDTILDLCYTPEINEFNGMRGIQLRLEAVRPTEK
jgi:single-stranded-DNA-specific exonuclease